MLYAGVGRKSDHEFRANASQMKQVGPGNTYCESLLAKSDIHGYIQ